MHCCLAITQFDAIQIKDTLTVGEDQRVQGQDLKHLQSGDQSASTLLDDVANTLDRGLLVGEWTGYRGVAQLDNMGLLSFFQLLQHIVEFLLGIAHRLLVSVLSRY